ncbi:MAG: hypothetical protein IJE70_07720 [Oscillospiraceae bacterium]|nr:hypothetical protein [Oscillospiraceae bacterium]
MGAIGVLIMNLFLGFYDTIKGIIYYIKWHKRGLTDGTIKGLKDKDFKYDDSGDSISFSHVEYTYDLEVVKEGVSYVVEFVEYSKDREGNAKFKPNDNVSVYVDFDAKKAVCEEFLRKELFKGPAICAFCIVSLILCLVLVFLFWG